MIKIKNLGLISLFFISLIFSNNKNLTLVQTESNNNSRLNFKSEIESLERKDKLLEFINDSFEISDEINLPSQTTFYQIESDKDINVSYTINDSYFEDYENIISSINEVNVNEYEGIYPPKNLIVSKPMIFRGVLIKQITFIPYQINFDNITKKPSFNDKYKRIIVGKTDKAY